MTTYSQLSTRLLRDAAKFFRNVAAQNEPLREQMNDNALVYDQIADLVEKDPLGEIDLDDESPPHLPPGGQCGLAPIRETSTRGPRVAIALCSMAEFDPKRPARLWSA